MIVDKWPVIHEYRRFSKEGLVDPLLCPFCKENLVASIEDNLDPFMKCLNCKTSFHLEDAFFDKMVTVLEEAKRLR